MKEEVEAVFRRHMEAAPYAKELIKRIAFEVVPLLPESPPPAPLLVGPDLTEFRKFVDLIEGRAMACDGPVTPFLDQLEAASDAEKARFTAILGSIYRGSEERR